MLFCFTNINIGNNIYFVIMSYTVCAISFIFAILFCGGIFYVIRQCIKPRRGDDVDIPVFLVGGEYPADNSVSGVKTDWLEVCFIYTRCK